jgi:hypothetical protein
MKFKIYSPSYKRNDVAITHKLFNHENFCYVVREEEANFYKHLGVHIKIIPKGKVKDIATTRNWILENKDSEYVVMVDDDIKNFYWTKKRIRTPISKEELTFQIENGFQLAEDCGSGLFGMNLQCDPMFYRISTPFSFNAPVLGPFIGILDTSLRYDENLPLKEDYDYFIQQLRKHRKIIRANFLTYDADHLKLKGGCQTYRNEELEKKQNELLIKKWGTDVIDFNPRNPESINLVFKRFL